MVSLVNRQQSGFGYISVLMLVMILGWVGASRFEDNQTKIKREKEKELLFILEAYHQAIENYYLASDDGTHALPEALEQLLLDRRFVRTKRYLRKLYVDPMTGTLPSAVRNEQNKIIGIYSSSRDWIMNNAGFERLYKEKGKKAEVTLTVFRDMTLIIDLESIKKKIALQKRLKNTSQ